MISSHEQKKQNNNEIPGIKILGKKLACCKKCNCTKADDDDDDIDSGMQIPWDDEINGMFTYDRSIEKLSVRTGETIRDEIGREFGE